MPPKRKQTIATARKPKKRRMNDGASSSEPISTNDATSSTTVATVEAPRQRRSGTEKAYPKYVKSAIESQDVLRCNRRGLVSLSSSSEKPSLSVEELLENRRRGMSYASIGRKLGIDPSKDEVLNVYRAMKVVAPDTPDIEIESVPVLKHYPTPLWFLWKSEADIIAQECIPSLDGILSMGVCPRIVSRLGEDASTKLAAFVEVSDIVKEEVGISLTSIDRKTEPGKILVWSNNLQSKVADKCGTMWTEIGKYSLQQTPDIEAANGHGRCRCGSCKALKSSWHGGVHPSFFWGCKSYTRFDQARHDKAIGVRGQPFEAIIATPRFNRHLVQSELHVMLRRLDETKSHYASNLATNADEVTKARQVFGEDFPEEVEARALYFDNLKSKVSELLSQREQRSATLQVQVNSEE